MISAKLLLHRCRSIQSWNIGMKIRFIKNFMGTKGTIHTEFLYAMNIHKSLQCQMTSHFVFLLQILL